MENQPSLAVCNQIQGLSMKSCLRLYFQSCFKYEW
jgi:hypothetical protein